MALGLGVGFSVIRVEGIVSATLNEPNERNISCRTCCWRYPAIPHAGSSPNDMLLSITRTPKGEGGNAQLIYICEMCVCAAEKGKRHVTAPAHLPLPHHLDIVNRDGVREGQSVSLCWFPLLVLRYLLSPAPLSIRNQHLTAPPPASLTVMSSSCSGDRGGSGDVK